MGWTAGVLWALYPLIGFSDVLFLWSTSLFALMATTCVLAAFALRPEHGVGRFIGHGLLVGTMVLTETAGLVIAFWLAAYLVYRFPFRQVAPALLIGLLVPALWVARNTAAFGDPVFLRSNFGLELYRSVTEDDLASVSQPILLPNRDEGERVRFLELGELES